MPNSLEKLRTALAGRYAIDQEIGSGGMAFVYRADDLRHGRSVAIKVLKPELAAAIGPDRFLREIEISARLRHPHILPVYDSGEAGGSLFYVMPYVEGESLRDRLTRERQLAVDESVRIAREVADALAHAHEQGVIHRDIKPANILLESGHAVVADFGIARAVDVAGAERLTQTGIAVGTPGYMSPEQSEEAERADVRSDMYSLACVLYEMLAGVPPFTGPTNTVIMARHALDPVPPLITARSSTPPPVARAVEKALSKTPADRFESMAAWVEALAATDPSASDHASAVGSVATSARSDESDRSELAIGMVGIRGPSGDSDLTALADALSEDITTGLTRFTYLRVVSGRESAAADTNPAGAAAALGVRYLLSGRVRRAGPAVRVSVQLVDGRSGSHLWAESYDRSLDSSNLFDVQDGLTDRIVATVADQHGVLIRSMSASVRDRPIEEMDALDAVFLTFDYWQVITPQAHLRTREALERAVELDAGSADAWACLSMMYCEEYKHDYNVRPDPLGRALGAARRAADVDRACQHAYYALAQAHYFSGDIGKFKAAAERAVALNRRDGNTVAFMGILLAYAGAFEQGTRLIRDVIELNPHHPGWYLFGIFYDHFVKEEYELALAVAQAINLPGYYPTHLSIATAAGHLGRLDVARSAVADLLDVYPAFVERGRAEYGKWVRDEAVLDRYFAGLELAGL